MNMPNHAFALGRLKTALALLCAVAFVAALSGCTLQAANETADDNASANRQFIAQLNSKTNELAGVLSDFQSAVADQDAVGMKAASDRAEKIIESVKSMDAPKPSAASRTQDRSEDLNNVKDLYAQGMEEMNSAMNDYADLYSGVAAGSVNAQVLNRKTETVQTAYDRALDKIEKADKLLSDLGNDTDDASSGDSSDAANSSDASSSISESSASSAA